MAGSRSASHFGGSQAVSPWAQSARGLAHSKRRLTQVSWTAAVPCRFQVGTEPVGSKRQRTGALQ